MPKTKYMLKTMTNGLLDTYKRIKKKSKRKPSIGDDSQFQKLITSGKVMNERYKVDKVIGKGVFGVVLKAYDTKEKKDVAIKVMKN